jgi:molybdopterin-guanine dinucleotide biosynthesis protein A
MTGRIKKKLWAKKIPPPDSDLPQICPLCQRMLPKAEEDAHHLIPRSEGGRVTVLLHRLCHRTLHALLTEKELARNYSTIEALRQHPEVARFVEWVQDKPPDFYERTRKSRRLREK